MLGDLFADPNIRITSTWCMGMNQHTRGTAINRLVHGIHLLSGHFGKPGDAPTSLTGQPSACGTAREVGTLCHTLPGGRLVAKPNHTAQQCEKHWNLPAGRIKETPGYHTVLMFEKFCTPKDKGGDIDTIMVQVTNPGQTLPNLKKLYHRENRPRRQVPHRFRRLSDRLHRDRRPRAARRDVGREKRRRMATPSAARSNGSRWSSHPARRARMSG